ncbi:MAG: glutamate 5-kinase [Gammaproteobacteria bacterium]|nr:glutamate 5-kinase [Gammaproteobacteria bacterium]
MRPDIQSVKRCVVKIGSALLTADGRGLDYGAIALWADQMAALQARGVQIILVSSGAIAEGMVRLGWKSRPQEVHRLQAAAAVGQAGLAYAWERAFETNGLRSAQVLLTHDDLAGRRRYLNARATLNTLIDVGAIPFINENDTVTTDEIKLGDNDNLAALVASLVGAELVMILTDQPGLFSADPRKNPNAELIPYAEAMDTALDAVAGDSKGVLGSGGMATKLSAARRAARAGAATIIASGREEQVLSRLFAGEQLGTYLAPLESPMLARKHWLANQLQSRGQLVLDAGAAKRIRGGQSSLLPVGVVSASGRFRRGEMVSLLDESGQELARGLVNYDVDDTRRILGVPSAQIAAVLGFTEGDELVHRDNMVMS